MEKQRFEIENGYLLDVPVYEGHRRGRNWMAVIELDPRSPGGLKRQFMKSGRGDYYYSVEGLEVGDAVEFGADYYTGSGHKRPSRWYGIVTDITNTYLELIGPFDTPREAIRYSEQLKKEQRGVSKNDLLKEIVSELEKMSIEQLEDVLRYVKGKTESFSVARLGRLLGSLGVNASVLVKE